MREAWQRFHDLTYNSSDTPEYVQLKENLPSLLTSKGYQLGLRNDKKVDVTKWVVVGGLVAVSAVAAGLTAGLAFAVEAEIIAAITAGASAATAASGTAGGKIWERFFAEKVDIIKLNSNDPYGLICNLHSLFFLYQ